MNRKRVTTVAMFTLAASIVATAAYAPHSDTLAKLSRKTGYVSPCATTTLEQPMYPVPSEEVIARGHSGSAK